VRGTCYLGALPGMVHINLAADTDPLVRHVDARLDREQGSGDQLAIVVGLEVIEVRAIAVDALVEAVTGAVDKVLSISRLRDHPAGDAVEIAAANFFAAREGLVRSLAGGLARVPNDTEYLEHLFRGFAADEGAPGDVGVDRAGLCLPGPDIEEQQIPGADLG